MRWIRWALAVAGSLALLYAVTGALASRDMRLAYLRFLFLVLVGHELVLVPLAVGVGVLMGRFVPSPARAVLQAGLFLSAAVVVVGLPGVLGLGRSPDLPSALPRDYARGMLVLLAVIWIGVGARLTVDAVRTRRSPR